MSKNILTSGCAFSPDLRVLDFAGVTGFDVRRLYAVLNVTSGDLIYAVATPGLGYVEISAAALTLAFNTAGMNPTDKLLVLYDEGTEGAPADAAWDGAASRASHTSILKAVFGKLGGVVLAAGSAVIGKVGLQIGGADLGADNPVPVREAGAEGAIPIPAVDADVVPGRLFAVTCTAAGNVSVTLKDGSTYAVPVGLGFQAFPFAVKRVNAAGTTAAATYANLK